jgi:pantothenate synthetase
MVHPDTLEELTDSRDGAVICAAMWCDGVRLIDNVELPVSR